MKRFLIGIIGLGLLLIACQRENIVESGSGSEAVVTVSLYSPDAFVATKGAALNDGSNSAKGGCTNVSLSYYDIRYQVAVYQLVDGAYTQIVSPQVTTTNSYDAVDMVIKLTSGESYRFVAWADFVTTGTTSDLHYDTSDLSNIYCLDSSDAQLNDESRDAYYAVADVEIESTTTVTMELKRPFAKLRLVTNDYADAPAYADGVSISYYGCTRFTALNALTGEVTGETLDDSGTTVYTGSLATDKEYTAGLDAEDAYRTMLVDYLLAKDGEQEAIHFVASTLSGSIELLATDVSTNVPIQRNYLTTVTGAFLATETVGASITIEVSPDFSGSEGDDLEGESEDDDNEEDDSTPAWYEANDDREFLDGWCYGAQNTYFIEQKASGEGVTTLSFEVKARGDTSMVKEPKYYGWLQASDYTSVSLMQFTDGTSSTGDYREIGDDYTVTVQCVDQGSGTGYWGHLAIYDEDYNVLWSFMIWKYLSGDAPGTVTYSSIDRTLLDRHIGSPYSNAYRVDNLISVENTEAEIAYFQWGRPAPFPKQAGNYTLTAVTYDVDLEYAISHPTVAFYASSGTTSDGTAWSSNNDWKVGDNTDALWGAELGDGTNYDSSIVGVKTIYDPCPEGYRVCDPAVSAAVKSDATMLEASQSSHHSAAGYPVSGSTDSPLNASLLAYPLDDGSYDYWLFGGIVYFSNSTYTNRTSTSRYSGYAYWNNCAVDTGKASCLCGYYSSSAWTTNSSAARTRGHGVRCQVDEYGR